jgi:hypothetical protein
MMNRSASLTVVRLVALVVASCAGSAGGGTFAPTADQEYIEQVTAALRGRQSPRANAHRFSSGIGSRRVVTFLDEREVDPADRDYEIFWSYAQNGLALEPSDATLFHPNPGFRIGQAEEPLDAMDGRFDDFQNVLFTRLNTLPRPFGFANDGGQRTWQTIVNDAINRWGQVCAIQFVFVGGQPVADQINQDNGGDWDTNAFGNPQFTNRGEGDIRIAMCELDGPTQPDGTSGGLLAWTYDSVFQPEADFMDDNNTPDDPSDDVENLGYLSNIILDKEEQWNDPARPNLLATVITREIGFAIGVLPSCPANPAIPFSLMQEQDFLTFTTLAGPYAPGTQDALPQLFFQELQEDDIRAVHFLYGDSLDTWGEGVALGGTSIEYTDARDIFFVPVPGTNVFTYKPHLGIPSNLFPEGVAQLSIHDAGDIDRWRLGIPDNVVSATLRVTIEPRGTPFLDGVVDFNPLNTSWTFTNGLSVALLGCEGTTIAEDPRIVQDLRIRIEAYDPFTNVLQLIDLVNLTPAGQPEEVEIPITAGTYFISIEGSLVNDVQLYDLTIEVETPLLEAGLEAQEYLDRMEIQAARDEGAFGANVTIGVVDGQHFADAHDVFSGRTIDRVNWPGVGPATTTAGTHATIVAGVAGGAAIGGFEGVAPEAGLASASVATTVFSDGSFAVGKNSLYFALLGLTDPATSASLGLPSTANVVVSTFGGGGRTLNGEDTISQAFDVVASRSSALFVLAAGNGGQIEGRGFPNCPITAPDANGPGADFQGSQTIVPPATAFNGLVVGAVGIVDPNTSPIEFANTDLVTMGFSSKGPIDSFTFTAAGGDSVDRRAGVEILAIGSGLTTIPPAVNPVGGIPGDPCEYHGAQPRSLLLLPSIDPGDDPDAPANPGSFQLAQGTSVAAGIVAGSAALLQDLALDQFPPLSIHPMVIKAVLMTGAVKLEGWTNLPVGPGRPQDQRDGFDRHPRFRDADPTNDDERFLVYNFDPDGATESPLDRAQGAGVLNLRRSVEIYLTGYAPAIPPQANFDGPTIDPAVTSPTVPTIRRPDEPEGPGSGPPQPRPIGDDAEGGGGAAALPGDEGVVGPALPTDDEVQRIMKGARGNEPAVLVATPMQASSGDRTRDPDLKVRPGQGGLTTTGPQTPFQIPSLGDGEPGTGPPTGSGVPGAIDPGVRPVEIGPIFVDPLGWDHANIDQRNIRQPDGTTNLADGFIDYVIDVPLLAERLDPVNPGGDPLPPDRLTVTLCWQRNYQLEDLNFANPDGPRIGGIRTAELENLDLELFPCDSLGNIQPGTAPVRTSESTFSNVEHLFTDIPLSSLYLIRVRWIGTQYDFRANQPLAEQQYGVAWRVDFSPRPQAARPTNITDLTGVLSSFGGEVGNERYALSADMDTNGRVDFKDVVMVLKNWSTEE